MTSPLMAIRAQMIWKASGSTTRLPDLLDELPYGDPRLGPDGVLDGNWPTVARVKLLLTSISVMASAILWSSRRANCSFGS
jgi:hypothetical protein